MYLAAVSADCHFLDMLHNFSSPVVPRDRESKRSKIQVVDGFTQNFN